MDINKNIVIPDISNINLNNIDLNNIDLKQELKYRTIDIYGLAKKVDIKTRECYSIKNGTIQLKYLIKNFNKDKCYKFISVKGGFSGINFVDFISEREIIKELTICSLAIGKKHIKHLDKLYNNKKIEEANFIVGDIFEKRGLNKKYDYYKEFIEICKKNNWIYKSTNNNCKLVLMRTDKENYYTLETSSNFNENPKMEQFSFEENKKTYKFYYRFIKEVIKK